MNFRVWTVAAAGLTTFGALDRAAAQTINPDCQKGLLITQDACQKAFDLFQYMAPQLGIALTGGNAILGQGGTLGGLGHFTIEARANLLRGTLPQIDQVTPVISGAQRTTYTTTSQLLGLPGATAAVGIFQGIPLGLTNVGGIDALVAAMYVPNITKSSVSVSTTGGSWKFGYGLRLGLLQESLVVPGVSVTWLKRDLPTTAITGTASGSTLSVNDLSESTTAWRFVASKSLVVFGLAAGVGRDKYASSANVSGSVGTQQTTVSASQSLTRTNYFGDLSLNLVIFKIVGEIGMVQGGTVPTYNRFDKLPDASRLFGSVGIRFGW